MSNSQCPNEKILILFGFYPIQQFMYFFIFAEREIMSLELEERTFLFAERVRKFCRKTKWDFINVQDIKQLVRSSGSVSANYIEANEHLGTNDKIMRMRIARKEAKESIQWLRLIYIEGNPDLEKERSGLLEEADQLRKILSSIIKKL